MIKQLSGIVLALSVAGLTGCGMMPTSTGAPGSTLAVAQVGQHGATVTLDFGQGIATQAVHRWVKDDVVRYHVYLRDVTAGLAIDANDKLPGVPVLDTGVAKDRAGVKFAGLSFGKKYHAYVQIMGNEGGVDDAALLEVLNKQSRDEEGVGYVVYDFTDPQDIDDNQSGTVNLRFDDVAFNGKGGLTIKGPEDGEYVNAPGGPSFEIEP